ncbi:phosphotransferase [Streptomyces sp. MUM 136J]|uniref:phosphotransferase family protein n=1 Tax=Streptomyces sp. MUM 136J TaxID=2791992 RepID=UPI001F04B4C6|nr:phosphotransferase [Streptomyces sp. MUM 136J]MCH0567924.1 phosphotransferase [Streptomyces sp. MUM 136J]
MRPHLPHRTHTALVRFFAGLRRRRHGEVVAGHHNRNRILPVGRPLAFLLGLESGRTRAKFRVPCDSVVVLARHWREPEVLSAVCARLDGVPRCLADLGTWSLHEYVTGTVLAEETPKGPVGPVRTAELAAFFARLAAVPADALPPRPADWPASGDSQGFLERLARFTEERVYRGNRARFGELFDALGIPDDLMRRFLRSVPTLTGRPFVLLHTDVHRANVVVTRTPDGERLSVLDWELSLYGDPLHDLATHLVRMDYDDDEHQRVTGLWAEAMHRAGQAPLTAGLAPDLTAYLRFEHVQSVFPDVMRAALGLPGEALTEDFARAAERIHDALRRAWTALDGAREPVGEADVVRALRRWHAADTARRSGGGPDGEPRTARRRRPSARGSCEEADLPERSAARPEPATGPEPAPARTAAAPEPPPAPHPPARGAAGRADPAGKAGLELHGR